MGKRAKSDDDKQKTWWDQWGKWVTLVVIIIIAIIAIGVIMYNKPQKTQSTYEPWADPRGSITVFPL